MLPLFQKDDKMRLMCWHQLFPVQNEVAHQINKLVKHVDTREVKFI